MPQMATFSIGAKVEKGPEVKSDAKFEIGSYAAIIEETVSKCCWSDPIQVHLPKDGVELLVISADKYMTDSDANPAGNGAMKRCDDKYVKYYFDPTTAPPTGCHDLTKRDHPVCLRFPHIFAGPTTCLIPWNATKLYVHNELTIDIKVSVLILLKKPPKTPPVVVKKDVPAMAESCAN